VRRRRPRRLHRVERAHRRERGLERNHAGFVDVFGEILEPARGSRREGPDRGAAQRGAVAAGAERKAEVAREAAHIEALARPDRHRRDRPLVLQERDLVHRHLAGRKIGRRVVARERVRALAADMHRAERRRLLHDLAEEPGERPLDRLARGRRRHRDLAALALAVVGGGERREVDIGLVALLRRHEEFDRLRRAAERDHEHAGRQRVERAGVARLRAARAAARDLDGAHRAHAEVLVEDEDAGEVAEVAHRLQCRLFPLALRGVDR